MTNFTLDPLDLAALLCSRVCHDVISPVGAIANGLEVLESEKDPDMRGFAMDLIKKSTSMASARLQFCRLAFGAAGSAGAAIDTGDAEQVARGLLADEKTKLVWNATRSLLPKNKVKLLLNLVLIASQAIPRGGVIDVTIDGTDNDLNIRVTATGLNAKLASHTPHLLAGEPEGGVDGHGIQAFYTGLVAREAHLKISATTEDGKVILAAVPDGTAAPVFDTGMIGVAAA
jgi:histidine phosphotransferase ChpT